MKFEGIFLRGALCLGGCSPWHDPLARKTSENDSFGGPLNGTLENPLVKLGSYCLIGLVNKPIYNLTTHPPTITKGWDRGLFSCFIL